MSVEIEQQHIVNAALRRQAEAIVSMSKEFAGDPCDAYAQHMAERASAVLYYAKQLSELRGIA